MKSGGGGCGDASNRSAPPVTALTFQTPRFFHIQNLNTFLHYFFCFNDQADSLSAKKVGKGGGGYFYGDDIATRRIYQMYQIGIELFLRIGDVNL